MNPAQILVQFDRISDAPDAIPRLRHFILDLAVRGKLVEQDPRDEPASELLKRIQEEKARLAKEGIINPQSKLTTVADGRDDFVLPYTWVLTTLGEVAHKITDGAHKTPTYVEKGVPFISVKDFSGGRLDFSYTRFISPEEHAMLYKRCDPRRGDILIGRIGTLGKAVLVNTDIEFSLFVSVGLIRFSQDLIVPAFFRLLLNSPHVESEFDRIKIGGATHTNKLNLGDLHSIVIPLPPLAEQHRIVAKVDELMALCDQLETAQAERESRRDRLMVSSLNCLNNGADPDAFRDHARFYLNHLPRLTTKPEHIQQLRQTILNLAVRGKLVLQDSKDEPVAKLLQRIDQERNLLAKEDRRADADRMQLLAAEWRWDVPPTWDWRGLADLALFIDYRGKTPTKTDSGIRLITAKNVRRGQVNLDPEEFIAEATYRAWMTRGFPRKGDILFTTEAPMGNAAVVCLDEKFGLAQRVINFRLYSDLYSDFMVLQILSEPFQSILDKTATGLTAKGIKAAKLKRLPLAVPPKAEQHRIVAKVHELMALCDKLEAQLTTTHTDSRRLLDAVLHEALAT